jgi:hypothetical protein
MNVWNKYSNHFGSFPIQGSWGEAHINMEATLSEVNTDDIGLYEATQERE